MIYIKKNRITLLNIVSNLILQMFTIISGFILPKLILENFGSDVNGLVSSITQFLSYISLLEGGVTSIIMTALYKPLVNKDTEKISSIMNTSKIFFRKISLIFIIYTLLLSIIYPIIFKTEFSFGYVMSLIWIISVGLLIQYMFSITMKTLLNSDKKIYIVSFVQIIIIILNIILSIIVIKIFPNIHLLKIISSLLFLLQPIIYSFFIKKYFIIDKNVEIDNSLLKNRWNGFAINFAAFIHFSTDVTILTIFTNLQTVSIYSVYSLVTNGLRQLVQAVTSAINPTIGQAYAKGNVIDLNEKLDLYEYITFIIVFFMFTLAGLLITPFVMIYTSNITDANYYQPLFGILIVVSEALYLIKFPHLHLAYSANKYKEITPISYVEAISNIVISLILVQKLGIIGIVIGTICAMLIRLIYHVYYSTKIIPTRKQWKYYRKLVIFMIVTLIGIYICKFVCPIKIEYNILSWITTAIVYSIIFAVIYVTTSIVFFKKQLLSLYKYIKK